MAPPTATAAARSLLVLALGLCTATAVNYVYDEFLFTKDTWHKWKLANPLEDVNPTDLASELGTLELGLKETLFNSLDGPTARRDGSAYREHHAMPDDVETLDEMKLVEHASKIAQCSVCHVLLGYTWSRVTSDLLSGEDVTLQQANRYLQLGCSGEALDIALRKFTIYKVGLEGRDGVSGFSFVVRERRVRSSEATAAEEEAMRLSCQGLVVDSGADLAKAILKQLAVYRRELYRLLMKYGREVSSTGDDDDYDGNDAAADDADILDDDNDDDGDEKESVMTARNRKRFNAHIRRSETDDDDADSDEYVDPDDLDDDGNRIVAAKSVSGSGSSSGGSGSGKASAASPAKGSSSGSATAKAGAAAGAKKKDQRVRGLRIEPHEDDDGDECVDLNERCATWAAIGECEANPKYMIGSPTHRGHCRRSCGQCDPGQALARPPELRKDAEALSSALLLAAKNLGCGASAACLSGLSATSIAPGLIKQQQQPPPSAKRHPPGITEFPGGFVLGRPTLGEPTIQHVEQEVPPALAQALSSSSSSAQGKKDTGSGKGAAAGGKDGSSSGSGKDSGSKKPWSFFISLKDAAARARVAEEDEDNDSNGADGTDNGDDVGSGGGSGSSSGLVEEEDPVAFAHEVERVLWGALRGKLLSLQGEFFTFEFLYRNHTRQYHYEPQTDTYKEDWLLGRFSREAVNLVDAHTGAPPGLEELDLTAVVAAAAQQHVDASQSGGSGGSSKLRALVMQHQHWPYVKQVYDGGDGCVLSGGKRTVRRSEVRLACAPDERILMVVREPDFCRYVFVVYVPELCAFKKLRPRPLESLTSPISSSPSGAVAASTEKPGSTLSGVEVELISADGDSGANDNDNDNGDEDGAAEVKVLRRKAKVILK